MAKLLDLITQAIRPNGAQRIDAMVMREVLMNITRGDAEIDFKARDIAAAEVTSHRFVPSMVGYGAGMIGVEGEAHLWTNHIHARQSFETLEMRYRKMLVSGEELVVNNGAVVEAVQDVGWGYLVARDGRAIVTQRGEYILVPNFVGDDLLTFTVKGEHGIDYQQFEPHDILRYTWRDSTTGVRGASGYIEVVRALSEFLYVGRVIEGSPEWLQPGMSLALWGNTVNPDRQGFIVLSARERTIAIYDGVRSPIIDASNLRVLLGRLDHIVDIAFSAEALRGYGLYSSNCYLRGDFLLRSTGRSIDTELSVRDEMIRLQAEQIELQAEQINIKADKVTIDGLLTVNGQIRADKIDVDNLVAKSIDTRIGGAGAGVIISSGLSEISILNNRGHETISINEGASGESGGIYAQMSVYYKESNGRATGQTNM